MRVFREFRLDSKDQRLWNGQSSVALTPKAFDVLRYLVEHPGRLITRDELLDALWSENYVNPELINKYILEIRKALADRPEKPTFVETIAKRGYRFIASVRDENAASTPSKASNQSNSRMVGRASELEQLNRHLQSTLAGQRQIVFVTGEAGIGKTTLVDSFHETSFHASSLLVGRGQCVEGFGGKEAYYPVLEALGHLLRDENSSLVHVLAKCAPTWLVQFPSLIQPEQRDALQREILGATRERMVREMCEALEAFTAATPLAMILEDLHWVDPTTLDLISALARRRQPARLMILATFRPADVIVSESPLKGLKQDLLIHHLCAEVRLERLEESEIAQFLDTEFHGLPSSLAHLIYRHSGGNALFMSAIIEEMQKRGVIAANKGGWSLTVPIEQIDINVPETLQGMLEAQLAQLTDAQRRVVESGSVAGERFALWTIAASLEISLEEIEKICEGLSERGQFIRRCVAQEDESWPSSASFEFRHSLYRQVVYRALHGMARSRLHRILGERLLDLPAKKKSESASEVALHFELGREYERAIYFLTMSSENSNYRFAYRESIEILEHAVSLVPGIPVERQPHFEIGLMRRIGDAYYALGDMTESARALERAADRAGAAGLKSEQVHAFNALARTNVFMNGDLGLAASQRALLAYEGLDDPLLLARTKLLAATLRLGYDRWRVEDAETCTEARATIRKLSDPSAPTYHEVLDTHQRSLQGDGEEAIKTSYASICQFYEIWDTDRQTLQGQYLDSLRTAGRGLAEMNESSSLVAYVLALSAKAVAHLHLGQIGQALEILQSARAQAIRNSSSGWIFLLREAWVRTVAFDFQGARQLCHEIIGTNSQYLSGQLAAMAAIADGYAALYEQDFEQARQSFGDLAESNPNPKFFLHWYWRMHAELGLCEVVLQTADIPGTRQAADRFLQSALSTGDPNLHAQAWNMSARVAIAEGDAKKCDACLRAALSVIEKSTVPLAAWKVHRTAWLFYENEGDWEAAESHRAKAQAGVLEIANSLPGDEPLRTIFLSALPVQEILSNRKAEVTPISESFR